MKRNFLVKTSTEDDNILTQYGIIVIDDDTQKNIKDAQVILKAEEKRFKEIILQEGSIYAFKRETMAPGTSMYIDSFFQHEVDDVAEIEEVEVKSIILECDDCATTCYLKVMQGGNIEAYSFATSDYARIESSKIKI